uniref:PAP-associated domain-containing protein n=1 Tax=Haemonchus contortus TaxID=6289 RepID=A0A7I4YYA9_HAECO|nr:Protein C53A5.16 [Haemonchus contortus]
MIGRTAFRRLATKARAIATGSREGRSNAAFVETIRSRHGLQLESLDQKLDEADRRRTDSQATTSELPQSLASRVLSRGCRFVRVGSSVNGLSSDNSDIDLVFFPTDDSRRRLFLKDFHGNADFKMQFITAISNVITREFANMGTPVECSVILHHLRVPLLIVHLQNGLSVDIQFPDETFQAIRNTNLMRHYVHCDNRLSKLFLYLRFLFDALEIRDSKYGLLSSYHILLLAVHFLQSGQALSPWPVLPVLCKTHNSLVGGHIPIQDVVTALDSRHQPIDWTSNNKMTTAELIVRFVDYYSTFDASQNAIYIEKGLAARRKQVSGDIHLLLLDPYSRTTVCRSGIAAKAFADSMQYLRRKMVHGQFLDSFPTFPEASLFKAQTKWVSWRIHAREKKATIDNPGSKS